MIARINMYDVSSYIERKGPFSLIKQDINFFKDCSLFASNNRLQEPLKKSKLHQTDIFISVRLNVRPKTTRFGRKFEYRRIFGSGEKNQSGDTNA